MTNKDEGLNIGLLYEIYKGMFRQEKYDPKDLDIDLRNLESVGYITYENTPEITERGKHDMEAIMNELIDLSEQESVYQNIDEMADYMERSSKGLSEDSE